MCDNCNALTEEINFLTVAMESAINRLANQTDTHDVFPGMYSLSNSLIAQYKSKLLIHSIIRTGEIDVEADLQAIINIAFLTGYTYGHDADRELVEVRVDHDDD